MIWNGPRAAEFPIILKQAHESCIRNSVEGQRDILLVSRRREDFGGARILESREEAQGGKRWGEGLDRGSAAA